jgi:hypothetical protein
MFLSFTAVAPRGHTAYIITPVSIRSLYALIHIWCPRHEPEVDIGIVPQARMVSKQQLNRLTVVKGGGGDAGFSLGADVYQAGRGGSAALGVYEQVYEVRDSVELHAILNEIRCGISQFLQVDTMMVVCLELGHNRPLSVSINLLPDFPLCIACAFDTFVKQSLYTPWRRLGGEEV